jgi:hypothetical protein
MVCGPVNPTKVEQSDRHSASAFSFSQDPLLGTGFGAFALVWAAPWRAAIVMADEVMREGFSPWR